MGRNSITFKLLVIIAMAFAIAALCILLLADNRLKTILDKSQRAVYFEKIENIIGMLERRVDRLEATGMRAAYDEDFKESALKDLRRLHYKSPGQAVSPFILKENGEVVMHPRLSRGDRSLAEKGYVREMLKEKRGELVFMNSAGEKIWCIFSFFKEWRWIVGYAVPIKLKYADGAAFRRTLGEILLVVTLLVLAVLFVVINRFTRPVSTLIQAAVEIASGNLSHPIDTGRRDELGLLARSFARMRDAVREKISDLAEKNSELVQEISERKHTEEALRESEERYRALIEASPNFILVIQEGRIAFNNPAAARMLGFSGSGEFMGLAAGDIMDPLSLEAITSSVEKSAKDGQGSSPAEIEVMKQDGGKLLLEAAALPIEFRGEPGVLVIGNDISERKKAEAELMQSEERYRSLVENTLEGFFMAEIPSGRFLFLNRRICKLFGYSMEEALKITLWDAIAPADHDRVQRRIKGYLVGKTGSYTTDIYQALRKDGSSFRAEVSGSIVTYGGKFVIQGLLRDITEQERLQEQLQKARKLEAIGTLAGGVAHDFNNILGIIIGNTDLALTDTPEWSPIRYNLEEIKKASFRARDVIQQIMAFSRHVDHSLQPLDLVPLVKEFVKLLRSSIPTTVDIRLSVPEKTRQISADPSQINQVLINLCMNSAHAMKEDGGVLEISVEDVRVEADQSDPDFPDAGQGDYVRLTVQDSGHGIPLEIQGRIFDPYFTTKDVGEGSGMGLAVAQGIVEKHGGKIAFRSQPGEGAVFQILFPALEARPAAETGRRKPLPGGKERILLVDDEQAVIGVYHPLLEKLGYRVLSKTESIEALDVFRSSPEGFDLVITDLTMPRLRGDRLAQEIMAIRPDIPIILCTGYSEGIHEEKARELGIKAFVMKPIDMTTLAKTVRRVLDGLKG
ncbi:MAG: PAS domain S-box protein [Deltaproteobacteria bacterium]|nr:PAS domain S-box protein [Deltaproteobacteria bacterium]